MPTDIPAVFLIRIDCGYAAGVVHVELVDLVISVSVINSAALAKGIAVDDTTDIGVVVQSEVTRSKALRFVAGSSSPRCPRHLAENHTAARNGADVPADGNKMRLSSATGNRKAGCGVIGRCPIHDRTIDNVVTAKDAADNATKKSRRNAVRILGRIRNSRLRVHIVDVEAAHNAAVAIGNKAAKRTLVILYLDGCVFMITAKVANDDAPKRVGPISKTAK